MPRTSNGQGSSCTMASWVPDLLLESTPLESAEIIFYIRFNMFQHALGEIKTYTTCPMQGLEIGK